MGFFSWLLGGSKKGKNSLEMVDLRGEISVCHGVRQEDIDLLNRLQLVGDLQKMLITHKENTGESVVIINKDTIRGSTSNINKIYTLGENNTIHLVDLYAEGEKRSLSSLRDC